MYHLRQSMARILTSALDTQLVMVWYGPLLSKAQMKYSYLFVVYEENLPKSKNIIINKYYYDYNDIIISSSRLTFDRV